jgi:hypothetical protein
MTVERPDMDSIDHVNPSTGATDTRRVSTPVVLSLAEVRDLLDADVIWCPNPAGRIEGVAAADLMSDVLVDSTPGTLLLTGLCTVQAIRTAAIADLAGVVFVRGKRPPAETVAVAMDMNIPVLVTRHTLFAAAGALYAARSIPPLPSSVPAHG